MSRLYSSQELLSIQSEASQRIICIHLKKQYFVIMIHSPYHETCSPSDFFVASI